MDTRVLYVVAILIAALSGGYYYFSGKGKRLEVNSGRNMTYSAKGIHLTQTDEQGNLYVKAKVDRLEQDMQQKTSRLDNLNASMYEDGTVNATFFARQANSFNDNEKIVLSQDVVATRLGAQGPMEFRTDKLTGYPKLKQLETDHQVIVQSPQAEFVSQGLKADLNKGQYEFFNIRGKYVPNT
ncbi:LPS export ABC transporter periplasmic protein LptC [Acinetobacter sp. UBA1297]|uniref:LPS export ABC transporter periplasmic protein LptC n=1 Tax=Acinetobacter sp. UBA1297 TaxID=1945925 RepID=UPI00257CA3A0|nr:LPS export ABC transporter periplasmic protein LptC [Acinetobacter sp. UBA1297]